MLLSIRQSIVQSFIQQIQINDSLFAIISYVIDLDKSIGRRFSACGMRDGKEVINQLGLLCSETCENGNL